MMDGNDPARAREGDLAMLIGEDRKQFIFPLDAAEEFQTHHGILKHSELIGATWGAEVESHLGTPFHLVQPSLRDLLLLLERRSQILYPKDIGYILLRLSAGPGRQLLEAGTGSGALTLALAWSVGREGRVYSVDPRADMQKLAQANVQRAGLADRVTFIRGRVEDDLDLPKVDGLFLDLPRAEHVLPSSLDHLRPGGTLGAIVPTANQVSRLLAEMERIGFTNVDVCEVLLRFYKTAPGRFRPADRMVGHTGYLAFGIPIERRAAAEANGQTSA